MTANGWGDAEFAALGRITFNFTELEYCAEYLLTGFFNDDLVATTLLSGESMSWKLEKLSVLATETLKGTSAQDCLSNWVKAAEVANGRRNQIIHSIYVWNEEGSSVTRMKATTRGGKWRGSSEPMDLAILQEVADLLGQGVEAAGDLVTQLAACPAWHTPSPASGSSQEGGAGGSCPPP